MRMAFGFLLGVLRRMRVSEGGGGEGPTNPVVNGGSGNYVVNGSGNYVVNNG